MSHTGRFRAMHEWLQNYDNFAFDKAMPKTYESRYDDTDSIEYQIFRSFGRILSTTDEDIFDLAGGVEMNGELITFSKINTISVVNLSEVAGDNLIIGAGLAGGPSPTGGALWTDLFNGDNGCGVKLRAGAGFHVDSPLDGYAVTGGGADILRIYNASSNHQPITYDLIVRGEV